MRSFCNKPSLRPQIRRQKTISQVELQIRTDRGQDPVVSSVVSWEKEEPEKVYNDEVANPVVFTVMSGDSHGVRSPKMTKSDMWQVRCVVVKMRGR